MKRFLYLALIILSIACGVNASEIHQQRYWVFFNEPTLTYDELREALQTAESNLSPKSFQRRQKMRSIGQLADECDLPIPSFLLDSLQKYSVVIYRQAKSIRSVSIYATSSQIELLQTKSWIKKIKPVAYGIADADLQEKNIYVEQPHREYNPRSINESDWTETEYAYSYRQLANINLIQVHQRGYTGRNVLVGMLDAGYNRLTPAYGFFRHNLFDSLNIVATRDFVNNDTNVTNHGDMGDGSHGTRTLSCIAGFRLGAYIGASPHASVALAKTENTQYERRIEEDNYIAGLEWLDSLGCDIVSSSISYRYFEDDTVGYPYRLRDGNTAFITIAADLMAQRGLLVANSTGNRGSTAEPWMSVPADGDTVLSVGAVNFDSTYATFSSRGPTYDGRIKPEVVAPGVMVAHASPFSDTMIVYASGTSLSTPIISGSCATLLSANPMLTPMDLIRILRQSAHQSASPDTFLGWGIPDINRALDSALVLASVCPPQGCTPRVLPDQYQIMLYPNPFNPAVTLYFAPQSIERNILVYDNQGREVDRISIPVGINQKVFQPSNWSNGTYFFKFPNSTAKKVVYLK